MKFLKGIFYLLFICAFIYGCAKIGRPEGGPVDEEPPKFVSSNPENFSTFFNKDEIKIQFNEFIKLNNPQQQIIFSPPILPKPQISPMGIASKEVRIKLALDSLQKNTTYTVNFGQSIEDNNEGNPLPFFKYVFSTGDYLDSLKVEGKVNDMYNRKTPEFVSLMLYEKDSLYSDSVVFKKTPTYISYAMDSTHSFSIENIRAGTYKLIALEDKNNDYKFNPGREKIGFVDEFIEIPTQIGYIINIFDTYKDFKPIRPKQATQKHLIFGYEGRLDTTDYNIDLLTKVTDSFDFRITKRRDADTLDYWFKPFIEKDSLVFSFRHQQQTDTLIVRIKDMQKDSLKIETKPKSSIGFKEKVYIRANLPIEKYNTEKIELINKDSAQVEFTARLDKFQNQLEINFQKEESENYNMVIYPEAVVDFYGATNDTLKMKLRTKTKADFSILDLTITNIDRYPAIIQLVDDNEKVEKSVTLTKGNKYIFEYVKPGKYFVKVIYDDNENGVWDTGDYLKKIQPEEVKYAEIKNELRANWDDVESVRLE